jgi:hypothetical protein
MTDNIKLPPLPKPDWPKSTSIYEYTAKQMLEYAREAAHLQGRDEALLRQALEALEQIASDLPWELTGLQADTITALRLRFGKGTEEDYENV